MKKLWIARDKDGELYVYTNKPDFNSDKEVFEPNSVEDDCSFLPKDFYPEVTFKNSPLLLGVYFN